MKFTKAAYFSQSDKNKAKISQLAGMLTRYPSKHRQTEDRHDQTSTRQNTDATKHRKNIDKHRQCVLFHLTLSKKGEVKGKLLL